MTKDTTGRSGVDRIQWKCIVELNDDGSTAVFMSPDMNPHADVVAVRRWWDEMSEEIVTMVHWRAHVWVSA